MLTGFRSGSAEICEPGEPRKEYSPQLPLGERYCAKADELGVRKRTVERWVRAYREHGEAGLAALSRGKPQGRTDERWVELAEDVMVENAEMSRPNKHSVIQQTRARRVRTRSTANVALRREGTGAEHIEPNDSAMGQLLTASMARLGWPHYCVPARWAVPILDGWQRRRRS